MNDDRGGRPGHHYGKGLLAATMAALFLGACADTGKRQAQEQTGAATAGQTRPAPQDASAAVAAPRHGAAEAARVREQIPPAPAADISHARPLPRPAPVSAAKAAAAFAPMDGVVARAFAPPPIAAFPGLDRFPDREPGGTLSVAQHPVSTFSVDVDTASYGVVRRMLAAGRLPRRETVRVEEMVNYFPYAFPLAKEASRPFAVSTTLMPSPWSKNRLMHVSIRGYDIAAAERPPVNLVLLVDTSGSMGPPDRLPLLQQGFRLFASRLRGQDRVAIVTYAGQARQVLDPTPGSEKDRILAAIDGLRAGGATAGAEGLQQAYALAERHFDRRAVNRVILATDGDFNVGISDPRELERFIAARRKSGIYLSILGVGMGNLNDALMQRLAQAGNGNAAHIDSLLEARKVMSEELASTLFPIANDVKIQVEFNPAQVSAYRLIGYETRALRREDFNDDRVDAGDIGAGHAVTAIYEITPAGAARPAADALRYQPARPVSAAAAGDELAFVKVRYKLPGEASSRLIDHAVRASAAASLLAAAPAEQRFAVAVAAFAQRLRGEAAVEGMDYPRIASLANDARGPDRDGYRAEFVRLVRMAETLERVGRR